MCLQALRAWRLAMYDSRSCKRASLAVPPLLAAAAAARKFSFFSCPVSRIVTALHARKSWPRQAV